MDRRSFLRTSAVGGTAAAAASLAAPAIAQGREQLTMVTTWPRGLAGVWDLVERVVNVAALTDGTLTIDAKAAGELVGAFELFDAAASGQADAYHGADYYWVGQSPAWAFFTAVPFGMTVPEIMTWYYGADGMQRHHELGEVFNIRPFLAGQTRFTSQYTQSKLHFLSGFRLIPMESPWARCEMAAYTNRLPKKSRGRPKAGSASSGRPEAPAGCCWRWIQTRGCLGAFSGG